MRPYYFFFLAGFELRALCLLGKCSTTWATLSVQKMRPYSKK
jgi:hypothetical protein